MNLQRCLLYSHPAPLSKLSWLINFCWARWCWLGPKWTNFSGSSRNWPKFEQFLASFSLQFGPRLNKCFFTSCVSERSSFTLILTYANVYTYLPFSPLLLRLAAESELKVLGKRRVTRVIGYTGLWTPLWQCWLAQGFRREWVSFASIPRSTGSSLNGKEAKPAK